SLMIAPYDLETNFFVTGRIDGKDLDLSGITERILESSQIRYQVRFDGETLTVKGLSRLSFFRPERKDERHEFIELVEADEGKAFLDFLVRKKQAGAFGLRKSAKAGWFAEFGRHRLLGDLDQAAKIEDRI